MTRWFNIGAGALCSAAAAWGWGSLVNSYPAPGQSPNGLAYLSATYICCSTNTPDKVWRIYRTNGSVVASYPTTFLEPAGVAYGVIGSTGYVWVADPSADYIYRMGWNSGSIYASFPSPGEIPIGLAYATEGGNYILYHTDYFNKRLYRLQATTGSIYASYLLPYTPRDLGRGAGYLWIADTTNHVIRAATTAGSTVASFLSQQGPPAGVCYDPAGEHVWVSVGVAVNRLFVYEIEGIGVAPASIGRVKALFR
jgi:DNA-binding beta-propeller fold protein YncE